MQDRIEQLAPGFGSRILARRILGPHQLEAMDANLVGGAINGAIPFAAVNPIHRTRRLPGISQNQLGGHLRDLDGRAASTTIHQ